MLVFKPVLEISEQYKLISQNIALQGNKIKKMTDHLGQKVDNIRNLTSLNIISLFYLY